MDKSSCVSLSQITHHIFCQPLNLQELTLLQRIAVAAIESRLAILDLSMNNYFNLPYGCYNFEEWGYGI